MVYAAWCRRSHCPAASRWAGHWSGSAFPPLNDRVRLQTSCTLDQFSPVPWAKSLMIPTFLYQVRDDLYTRPDDIQAMFDNIPIANKKLHWIEGTTRRWNGYTYFQRAGTDAPLGARFLA